MFSIEEPEFDRQIAHIQRVFFIVLTSHQEVLELRELVKDKGSSHMRAIYLTIVPKRREAIPMISMKMTEEMNESLLRETLAVPEIIYDNIGIGNHPHVQIYNV